MKVAEAEAVVVATAGTVMTGSEELQNVIGVGMAGSRGRRTGRQEVKGRAEVSERQRSEAVKNQK